MEYIIAIMGGYVFVLSVFMFRFWKRNKTKTESSIIFDNYQNMVTNTVSTVSEKYEPKIKLEPLPAEAIPDTTRLKEIKDSRVLAHVNNLIPEIFKVGTAVGNAVQGSGQVLYQAIIPSGAKLANSKDITGAARGFFRGSRGIEGHANFVSTNNSANVAANSISSAMGVASLVVGQYYMTQISAELSKINNSISRIADFQDNEYKSKVFALVVQIQKIAQFQVDIFANKDLRLSEISNLNSWEQECIELLGQANLTIAGFAKKNDLNYDEYEQGLGEAQNWHIYQRTLMGVLVSIEELKHTFNLGVVSREQCESLLLTYSTQMQDALMQFKEWHQSQIEKHGINVDECTRKRVGFDKVVHMILAWINEEHKFCVIPERTKDTIRELATGYDVPCKANSIDLFQEDVKIITKEGKIYYLPQEDFEKKAI